MKHLPGVRRVEPLARVHYHPGLDFFAAVNRHGMPCHSFFPAARNADDGPRMTLSSTDHPRAAAGDATSAPPHDAPAADAASAPASPAEAHAPHAVPQRT